jgi:HAD superfamily hydrolase (TIGR01458 family)
MTRLKCVLIDLSGTLHIENEIIPGSIEALNKLRANENNFKIKFVTNTTKESKNRLHQLLNNLGFSIEKHEIYTSLSAACDLIRENQLRPMLFLEECALEDFKDLNCEDPNAVVVGLAPNKFNYHNLNDAFR